MFCSLLNDLDVRFKPILAAMNDTIQIYGTDYSTYPLENKKTIAAAASLAVSIKSVLDTPVLTKDGQLTSESAKLLKEMKSDKPKTQRKTGVKKTKAVKNSLHDIVMQNTYEVPSSMKNRPNWWWTGLERMNMLKCGGWNIRYHN